MIPHHEHSDQERIGSVHTHTTSATYIKVRFTVEDTLQRGWYKAIGIRSIRPGLGRGDIFRFFFFLLLATNVLISPLFLFQFEHGQQYVFMCSMSVDGCPTIYPVLEDNYDVGLGRVGRPG